MVLTEPQTTIFFETEMGILPDTRAQIQTLGINQVEDLADYDKELINSLKEDLRKPTCTMQDPNNANRVVPQTPFVLNPLSCKKLLVTAKAVVYYNSTGHIITIASMRWAGTLAHFSHYLTALKSTKTDEESEAPKVTRLLPIGQWSEAFQIYLEKTNGVRNIPLAYVTRTMATPTLPAPALQPNLPYSADYQSITEELIDRASHTHTLYEVDNNEVFNLLETSLRSTQYAATLSPFKRTKNGRDARFALIAQ